MAVVVSASAIQHIETHYNYNYTKIDEQFVSASHANLLGTINFNEKIM